MEAGLAAGHGAPIPTAGMPAADHLLVPAAGTVMAPPPEECFVFVQQLVYITGGAAAPADAGGGGISLPTSSSAAAVDVTNSHAIVVDAGVGDVHYPSSRGGRRRRSVVWEHMELDPSGNKASCRYCTKTLSAKTKGGTTHLRRHVNRCVLRKLACALDI